MMTNRVSSMVARCSTGGFPVQIARGTAGVAGKPVQATGDRAAGIDFTIWSDGTNDSNRFPTDPQQAVQTRVDGGTRGDHKVWMTIRNVSSPIAASRMTVRGEHAEDGQGILHITNENDAGYKGEMRVALGPISREEGGLLKHMNRRGPVSQVEIKSSSTGISVGMEHGIYCFSNAPLLAT